MCVFACVRACVRARGASCIVIVTIARQYICIFTFASPSTQREKEQKKIERARARQQEIERVRARARQRGVSERETSKRHVTPLLHLDWVDGADDVVIHLAVGIRLTVEEDGRGVCISV